MRVGFWIKRVKPPKARCLPCGTPVLAQEGRWHCLACGQTLESRDVWIRLGDRVAYGLMEAGTYWIWDLVEGAVREDFPHLDLVPKEDRSLWVAGPALVPVSPVPQKTPN